jgi:glycosyltransferase involved in cell wall biosynthesis
MSAAPDVSVVLSTHNRCGLLAAALRCLLHQHDAPTHEIIVVDNRSTDRTREVVQEAIDEATDGRLRYVYEPRQGLSYARNAGIDRARASVVAFTDDDVRADPDWIAAIGAAFEDHPEASYVGGRVLPRWPGAPPAWLTRDHWSPLALQDHGSEPFEVGSARPLCLVGANLVFRADVFRRIGLFSPDVQLTPGAAGSTEDHELMRRVWQQGAHGVYVPSVVVRADVPRERMRRTYHRRWHYGQGRFWARMRVPEMERSRAGRPLGVPAHLYRQAAIDAVDRWRLALRRDRPGAFRCETRLCFFAGFLRERVLGRSALKPLPASACYAGLKPRDTSALREPVAQPQGAGAPATLRQPGAQGGGGPSGPAETSLAAGTPLVSVIIPCFNQACYLPESIGSALAQSHPHVEVIVVDDGSTDDTAAVAARHQGVRCLRQPNRGLAEARNAGLAASRGDFVVFLDADDRLLPDAIAWGVRALEDRPAAALAFGRARVVAADGSPMFTAPAEPVPPDAYASLLRSNPIWTPALALFRRDALDRAGGFDPRLNAAADYDLYLRIARHFPLAAHTGLVAEYRHHGAAMSRNAGLMLQTTLAVHRRQRRHTRADPHLRQAHREGRRFWQRFFGDQLVDEIRTAIGLPGGRMRAAVGLATLARHAPARLACHAGRWLRNRRQSAIGRRQSVTTATEDRRPPITR